MKRLQSLARAAVSAAVLVHPAAVFAADKYQVIWNFGASGDAAEPVANFTSDSAGNLYGTTSLGGSSGSGAVFMLAPPAKGSKRWTETLLHSFDNQAEGGIPVGGVLLSNGTLFGTTAAGGTYGGGTAYRLDAQNGNWSLTTLHQFGNGTDGCESLATPTLGSDGLLYGTTNFGGTSGSCATASGYGTAFSLSPEGDTKEYFQLYSFTDGSDGAYPFYGAFATDGKRLLIDTVSQGGPYGFGAIFGLKRGSGDRWTEETLYGFGNDPNDALEPATALVVGPDQTAYGCGEGGAYHMGAVFAATPGKHGKPWTETVIYSFGANANDPQTGSCALMLDSSGRIFGTATYGSTYGGGALFELSPNGSAWTEKVLHSFGSGSDGNTPYAAPIELKGALYGTTNAGGLNSGGVAYQFKL